MKSLYSFPKKALLLGLLITTFSIAQAEWDPEFSLDSVDQAALDELDNPAFGILKDNVLKYLNGSWCSPEKTKLLMELVLLTKPNVCVEIGACTGSSVLPVAATLKYLNHGKIFAIDAWSNAEAIKHLEEDDPNRPWWAQVNMKDLYEKFLYMESAWDLWPYCLPIRSPSNIAVNQVDEIDFLHLDGDYSIKGSLEDVNLYLPKVKSGGYVLLSNLFTMVKGKQPKLKAFLALFDSCEIVAEIERDNAVLFRKR